MQSYGATDRFPQRASQGDEPHGGHGTVTWGRVGACDKKKPVVEGAENVAVEAPVAGRLGGAVLVLEEALAGEVQGPVM